MAKILIIEDDADISAIERDYLELSGYQVAICADGTAGLSAALNEDYDHGGGSAGVVLLHAPRHRRAHLHQAR